VTVTVYTGGATVEVIPRPSSGLAPVLVSSDEHAPTSAPNQTLVLSLHASGGPQLAFGEQWRATVAEPYASITNPMTWAAQNKPDGLHLQPHDRFYTAAGKMFESYWVGYVVGTEIRLYAENRLDYLMAWADAQYPQASKTKRVAAGGSMGAWGCMTYALRRPDKFAAVFASRPRWKVGSAVQGENGNGTASTVGTVRGSSATIIEHHDSLAYISFAANKAPFVVFCLGRRDGFAPFADSVAAVNAMRATKRGFAFAWNDGDHSTGDILGTLGYKYDQFEIGKGYPLLTNCSHDKDPAVDLVGTINAGFGWRNVVETPNAWSCEISNAQATTVTVEPHSDIFTANASPKTITIAAGQWVPVSFSAAAASTPAIARVRIGTQGSALMLVCLAMQYAGGDAYERYQRHLVLTSTSTDLVVKSMTNGGPRQFSFARYAVIISPKPDMSAAVIRGTFAASGSQATVTVSLGNEADGPHFARVVPIDAAGNFLPHAAEGYPVYGFWIDRNGMAKSHPKAIAQNASFIWSHSAAAGAPIYSDVALTEKSALEQLPLSLPQRLTVTPFSTALTPANVARVPLVACPDNADSDPHYPCVTTRGITVTENIQGYTPQRMFDALPALPLVDGPRGICTAPYSTVLRPGRNVKTYVGSPWSLAVFDSTGFKRTLFGLRHRPGAVPYYETPANSTTHPSIEIVGDFDPSIPVDERYPLESWFLVWDERSLLLDEAAAPIGGEQPHLPYTLPSGEVISGPRAFMGDRRGWVWELRFSGTDRPAPAKVRKWITGLSDPWGADNMPTQNTFALAERSAHRICEWSMDAPNTKVRTILSSAGTGAMQTFGSPGQRRWKADVTAARALPVCAPESVRVRGNVLTYGSLAQEQVRAFDLATNAELGVVATPTVNYGGVGSYFVDHDVSDGTCGPAGTVFTVTFYNSNSGHPQAFLPGGAGWGYMNYTYGVDRGRGSWNGGHYPIAIGCGDGRFISSNSAGGIDYFCKADAYDAPVDIAKAYRGYVDYRNAGLSILHGPYLVNRNAIPVARGVNADRDYWLAMLGA
jgi:hypothetical protein